MSWCSYLSGKTQKFIYYFYFYYYFQTAFANPCVNSNRAKRKKNLGHSQHTSVCLYIRMQLDKPSRAEWLSLSSIRGVEMTRQAWSRGGPPWHGDNSIIVVYLRALPLIWRDRSFVWCQRGHQRATGHNAVATESNINRVSTATVECCWTLNRGFEPFFAQILIVCSAFIQQQSGS